MAAIILFGILFVLLFLSVPIAFAIGLSCILFIMMQDPASLIVIPQKMVAGNDSFIFLAVPMFTFAGYVMESGGISQRLVNWVDKLFGWFPGSVGAVTVITCTIFAALTGSGAATVAAVGAIMYPLMRSNKYSEETAAATIAAGGALGPIIPPSIAMIVYGSAMGVSIADMFLGGILPGLLIAVLYLVYNTVYAVKNKLPRNTTKYTGGEILKATWQSLGVLMLPVIILGGIYSGTTTPTEAATVSIFYCLALMITYGEFTIKKFIEICKKTVMTSAVIMTIVGISNVFAYLLAVEKIPRLIADAVTPYISTSGQYLIMLIAILMVVGALMDTAPSILILAPILVPIGLEYGLDKLHLGIVFCVTLLVGLITPPFGLNLFTVVSTTGVPFEKVVKGVVPFIICAVAGVLLIAFIPEIVLFLPNLAK